MVYFIVETVAADSVVGYAISQRLTVVRFSITAKRLVELGKSKCRCYEVIYGFSRLENNRLNKVAAMSKKSETNKVIPK